MNLFNFLTFREQFKADRRNVSEQQKTEDVVQDSSNEPASPTNEPKTPVKAYVLKKEVQKTESKESPVSEPKVPVQHKKSTISFRVSPSGESLLQEFDATAQLSEVRTWVNMVSYNRIT